jgi:hypothetical protein
MAIVQLFARLAAGLFFLSSTTTTHAAAARTHARDISSTDDALFDARGISQLQNRDDDPKGTPFKGFDGCSELKKQSILRAWWDVVDLARIPQSVNFDEPGALEQRFFGDDLGHRDDAKSQIRSMTTHPPVSEGSLC